MNIGKLVSDMIEKQMEEHILGCLRVPESVFQEVNTKDTLYLSEVFSVSDTEEPTEETVASMQAMMESEDVAVRAKAADAAMWEVNRVSTRVQQILHEQLTRMFQMLEHADDALPETESEDEEV